MGNRSKQRLDANPLSLMGLTDAMIEGDPEIVERVVEVEVVPANALVALEDGSMQFGSYTLTVKGLLGGDDADRAQWKLLGKVLERLEGAIQWLIGDWVLQAEYKWGEKYDVVAQKTGYSPATLKDYVYVARNVKMSVRTDKLSFGHHKRVADLPEEDQRAWLEWAVSQNASISQLRKALKPPTPPDGLSEEEQQASMFEQLLRQERGKFQDMKPDKRIESAERAEWLAEYYTNLARWVRGMG